MKHELIIADQFDAGGTLPPGVRLAGGAPAFDPPLSSRLHGDTGATPPTVHKAGAVGSGTTAHSAGTISRGVRFRNRENETPWTPEEDATLTELWGTGLSTRLIGEAMRRGKNSVIGRSHRLKLPPRASPIRPAGEAQKKPRVRVVKFLPSLPSMLTVSAQIDVNGDEASPYMDHAVIGLPLFRQNSLRASLPIPVGVLGRHRQCQHTASTGRPWVFCNAPSRAGYSWCGKHHAIVFKQMGDMT